MSGEQRLEQRIRFCQERWQRLSDDIASLQATYDRETRPDEKIRLKPEIDKKEAERREVETELALLESEWHGYANQKKKTDLIQDAHRLERNQAYQEAIETWEKISEIDPDDSKIANEMRRLNNKQQQLRRINDYIKQLTSKLPELKPSLFGQIITILRQPESISDAALGLIDVFVTGTLSAEAFTQAWHELSASSSSPSTEQPNYPVIANRLARGDIVLFLGSDISPLFTDSVPKDVAKELACKVNYVGFAGSLATIGEYYQISEYGRSMLVNDLRDLIYSPNLRIPLYQKLAQLEQPLVLVSAAYDTLLEDAFSQSGKKYVLIASIIETTAAYDVGKVLVQYSDKPEIAALLEEDLSKFKLIEEGYSLVYKIRGFLGSDRRQTDLHRAALTISEGNYFNFVRHMDKLIPSYVVRQFGGRGLYFLGYTPRHWEDRLIVNAILDKRRHRDPSDQPRAISNDPDPFVRAFWKSKGVECHPVDLREFLDTLEAYL
jgi:hypothetical protein